MKNSPTTDSFRGRVTGSWVWGGGGIGSAPPPSALHSVNFEFTEPLFIRYCPASLKFLPSVSLYRGPPQILKSFVLSPVRMTESYAQKGQFFPSPAGSQTPGALITKIRAPWQPSLQSNVCCWFHEIILFSKIIFVREIVLNRIVVPPD